MKHYFQEFKHCPKCGGRYDTESYNSADFLFICIRCGTKFYQNSKPATSTLIPQKANPYNLLFTRRAINPKKGFVDFPGGFLKYGEDPLRGAKREVKEELGVSIEINKLFYSDVINYSYDGSFHSVWVLFFYC
jgi:NAD+ diphosphatase